MSHLRGPDVKTSHPRFRANTSVLRLLVEALRNNGDDLAMVEGQTGKTATFADILQQSTATAAGLQSAGITAGDYVVLCCDKSILSYSLLLGIMFTGTTAVLFPPDSLFCTQVQGQTGNTATFADILQQSTATAAGLQSAGISAGDYIVLCCDKSILSYSLLLGVMFTGTTAVLFPPDSLFCTQVEGQTGKTATFADILQQSTATAAGLQSAGISAGDYIVLCCDKSILSYSLLLSIMFTGATAVLCPPDTDMIDRLTRGHTVKVILYDSVYSASVRISLDKMDPAPLLCATTDLEDLRAVGLLGASQDYKVHEVSDIHRHVSIIMFSSGTTGEPKGIQVTDVAIQLAGFEFAPEVNSLLIASPMYWYSSLCTFVSSIFNKYRTVMSNGTVARENMKVAEQYQVEGWFVSLGSMIQCINEPDLHAHNLSSVKKVLTGGELTLPNVVKSFMTEVLKGKVTLEIIFGNTECGILSSYKVTGDLNLGMCGQVKPGVELKILDDNGTAVALGCAGELWIKSIGMTPGYWSRPDLNSAAIDRDGFLQSGDSAFFDTSGNLYLRGRIGDLINYRGFQYSPAEAENILMSHPAVLDAVVVGKPHSSDLQQATAFVVKRAGAAISEEEIASFVDGQVDEKKKLRGGVSFRESLPRVAVGKVTRRGLATGN
ncbi:probable CoA ligase CCL7 isoform X2 [Homalodisca vitripennis]|uniref:probable CoA ligase CCL7 isoform X2 n=1 Tax=Homalodisca vitripennis TaxID=197043 RepID=UPI001EEC9354|nr:probable CoA ligase CCL7 isoform X2 [Homalodisca vitripennis]